MLFEMISLITYYSTSLMYHLFITLLIFGLFSMYQTYLNVSFNEQCNSYLYNDRIHILEYEIKKINNMIDSIYKDQKVEIFTLQEDIESCKRNINKIFDRIDG